MVAFGAAGPAVGAPFPARSARPHPSSRRRGRELLLAACSPHGMAGLGAPPSPRGCRGGRPRLPGTPVRDESAAVGCHSSCGGADPRPGRSMEGQVIGPDRTRACRHGQPERPARCSGVRIAPIKPLFPRVAGAPAGPQPVEWHPTVTVSSENGVPPRRGRPPAQPRGSVVNPSRPPHEARSRPNPRTPSTGPGPVWVAGWPRPGTARPPVVPPPDEHPVRTGGDRLPQQPGCVPRNVVST